LSQVCHKCDHPDDNPRSVSSGEARKTILLLPAPGCLPARGREPAASCSPCCVYDTPHKTFIRRAALHPVSRYSAPGHRVNISLPARGRETRRHFQRYGTREAEETLAVCCGPGLSTGARQGARGVLFAVLHVRYSTANRTLLRRAAIHAVARCSAHGHRVNVRRTRE
jgi:hypothetical protein